jgi:predicted RNase H-like HicB family nuclease
MAQTPKSIRSVLFEKHSLESRRWNSLMLPRYSLVIEWSDEDQVFLVTIPELAGARSHAATYMEAAEEAQRLIEEWIELAQDHGWPLPQPQRVLAESA